MTDRHGDRRTTLLVRAIAVGERVSFDQGRIVVELEKRYGQKARMRFTMHADVVVDKPAGSDAHKTPHTNAARLLHPDTTPVNSTHRDRADTPTA